jgi:hypothetical protein
LLVVEGAFAGISEAVGSTDVCTGGEESAGGLAGATGSAVPGVWLSSLEIISATILRAGSGGALVGRASTGRGRVGRIGAGRRA